MTGHEHYRKAEELARSSEIAAGQYEERGWESKLMLSDVLAKLAQTHATLAAGNPEEPEAAPAPRNIPAINLSDIISGLQDAIEYRQRDYPFCADCRNTVGNFCADHEEDGERAATYELIIATLQGPPDADERLRGLVKAAPPEEVAGLIDWTELNP